MKCNNCGEENELNSKFCFNCGKQLEEKIIDREAFLKEIEGNTLDELELIYETQKNLYSDEEMMIISEKIEYIKEEEKREKEEKIKKLLPKEIECECCFGINAFENDKCCFCDAVLNKEKYYDIEYYVNNNLNNAQLNKYEKLDKLQELKNNGTLSESEYEVEKYKILNTNINNVSSGKYTASLVLGILSFFSLIISIVGLVISVKAKRELESNNEVDSKVTAGYVMSVCGLILGIIKYVGLIAYWVYVYSLFSKFY